MSLFYILRYLLLLLYITLFIILSYFHTRLYCVITSFLNLFPSWHFNQRLVIIIMCPYSFVQRIQQTQKVNKYVLIIYFLIEITSRNSKSGKEIRELHIAAYS